MNKLRLSISERLSWFVIFVILWFAAFVGLALTGSSDYDDRQNEYEHYCKMVDLWKNDSELTPEKRAGWPPYKGECRGS